MIHSRQKQSQYESFTKQKIYLKNNSTLLPFLVGLVHKTLSSSVGSEKGSKNPSASNLKGFVCPAAILLTFRNPSNWHIEPTVPIRCLTFQHSWQGSKWSLKWTKKKSQTRNYLFTIPFPTLLWRPQLWMTSSGVEDLRLPQGIV